MVKKLRTSTLNVPDAERIGDEIFPLQNWLMPPYAGKTTNKRNKKNLIIVCRVQSAL